MTETLIKAGYQQKSNGYIAHAIKDGLKVDYREAEPNQWWHLIESYCDSDNTKPEDIFNRRIQCGELIFWMAEVANCVDKSEMKKLVENIKASGTPIKVKNETKPNVVYNRRKWNKEIQYLCFENITKVVEATYPEIYV